MRTRYSFRCSIPKKGKFGRVRTLHSWQSCFFLNQRDLYSKIICKHIAFLKENRQKHIKYKIKIVYNFYKAPKPANIVFDLVKGKYFFLLFFSFLALKIKENIPPGAGLTNFTKHIQLKPSAKIKSNRTTIHLLFILKYIPLLSILYSFVEARYQFVYVLVIREIL